MTKTYEAMFLMNPAVVTDWTAGEAEIKRLMDRAEAKVLGLKRWDERKLAYEIGGHKRGAYGLVFFEAAGDKLTGLERDAQLSESILRLLILKVEDPTPEKIEKQLLMAPAKPYERGEGMRDRPPDDMSPRPAPREAVVIEEEIPELAEER